MSRADRGAPRGMVPLVLRREISTRVRERSFLISTAITLIIVAAVVVIPAIFNSGDDKITVGLVGNTTTVQSALEQAAKVQDVTVTATPYADETAARTAIEAGDVDVAFLG